jgi:hypothetical protein
MARFTGHWTDYGAALERRGFVRIGGGYFSEVYAKPGSRRVIKVCQGKADDGWLAYAVWCRSNPSPFAPTVHRIKWHGDRTFFVAVIERLDMTVRDISDLYGASICAVLDHPRAPKHHKRLIAMAEIADRVTAYGKDEGWSHYDQRKWGLRENDDEIDALIDYCDRIHRAFKGIFAFDCHRSNCMFTEAGRFVITDPLSFSRDETRAAPMRAAA